MQGIEMQTKVINAVQRMQLIEVVVVRSDAVWSVVEVLIELHTIIQERKDDWSLG